MESAIAKQQQDGDDPSVTQQALIDVQNATQLEIASQNNDGSVPNVFVFRAIGDGYKRNYRVECVQDLPASAKASGPRSEPSRNQQPRTIPVHHESQRICDELASDPVDPMKRSGGIEWSRMDHKAALDACARATEDAPEDMTTRFNYARALAATDEMLAGQMIRELSTEDYPASFYYMGVFHETGQNGFERSVDDAIKNYQAALDKGVAQAANKLGLIFAQRRETSIAEKYWRRGSEMGDRYSVQNLERLRGANAVRQEREKKILALFGGFPDQYPDFRTALHLLTRYSETCAANNLWHCESICREMRSSLSEAVGNYSRDAYVAVHFDGCIEAIYSDLSR